jgi:hypothetical protein
MELPFISSLLYLTKCRSSIPSVLCKSKGNDIPVTGHGGSHIF